MREWRRWLVAMLVVAVLVILTAPDALLAVARGVRWLFEEQLVGMEQPLPRSVLVAVAMGVLFVVSFLVIFAAVRLFTEVGTSKSSRFVSWYDRVTPDSPQTKALVFMLVFTVVFFAGIAAFVPWLSSTLTEDSSVDDVVGGIKDGNYAGNVPGLFEDDAVRYRDDQDVPRKAAQTDGDGDGLPDRWERDGETPGGASLPGASPDRMDLYVQVNYGANISRLSNAERDQLRSVWANMPVENPDGSEGIDLHIVDSGSVAGRLDERVRIAGKSDASRYYAPTRLGDRYCSYHQVTLGGIQTTDTIGYAEAPGFSAALDGSTFSAYKGDVSFRVAMITHGLLHNVVGQVDGGFHTDDGWLAHPAPGNEQLSDAARRQLQQDGFVTSTLYRDRCLQLGGDGG